MPSKCAVQHCKNRKNAYYARIGVSFHCFPSDCVFRAQWISALGLFPHFNPTKRSVVCSQHFKPSDFQLSTSDNKRYLRENATPSLSHHNKGITKTVAILPKPQVLDEQGNISTKENLGTILQDLEHANSNLRRANEVLQMQLNAKFTCTTCVQLRGERDYLLKKLEDIGSTGKLGWKCTTSPGTADCPHRELFMDSVKEIANLNETIEKLTRHRAPDNISKPKEQTSVTRSTTAAMSAPILNAEEVYVPTWFGQSGTQQTAPVNETRFDTFNPYEAIVPKQEPPDVEDMSVDEEYILPDACEEEREVEPVVKQEPEIIQIVQKNTFGDCVVPIDESEPRKSHDKARFYSITCRTKENGETESFSEALETARKNAEKNTAAQSEPDTGLKNDETEKLAMVTRPMVLETAFGHFYVTPGVVRMKKIKKAKNLSPVSDTVTGEGPPELSGPSDPPPDTPVDGHLDQKQAGVPVEDLICKWCVPDERGAEKVCGMSFGTRKDLTKHAFKHVPMDRSGRYTCYWENCSRKRTPYKLRAALTGHVGLHTDKLLRCPHPGCRRTYENLQELTVHRRRHRKGNYLCTYPDCRQVFESQMTWHNHHRTWHETDMRFKCAFLNCNRTFPSPTALVKHTRGHTGEKPFACAVEGCGKKYAFKSALSDHVRVHKAEEEDEAAESSQIGSRFFDFSIGDITDIIDI